MSNGFFEGWSARKKLSFAFGILLILVIVGALSWWVKRAPKVVLFSDLGEADVGVVVAELDKLKQPYEISDDGHAILVAADAVHRTRMKLMAHQLPLHGVVGFELFNNSDFGVSDFVQKVNYQRALQGELTRTILSMDQVQDARVHLALPDQGLFRKEGPKAKASVTLTLRGGQALQAAQVAGIQRLIAASVPEVKADDVTVLDQHGLALSRVGGDDAELAAAGNLDAKQALEAHLTRKATRLLDEMFGKGEAMASVDVVLSHKQSRITTEEVLGAGSGEEGSHPAGIVTRERSTTKGAAGEGAAESGSQLISQETEYQTGKRVEQTNLPGGQVARINLAVVVRGKIDEAESARLRQLLAAAVGLQADRGDVIAIHAIGALKPALPASAAVVDVGGADAMPVKAAVPPAVASQVSVPVLLAGLLGVVALMLVVSLLLRGQRRVPAGSALNDHEREALLQSVRQWLAQP